MVFDGRRCYLNSPQGLVVSDDRGLTWRVLSGSPSFTFPVIVGPGEGQLAGVNNAGLHESRNGGKTWHHLTKPPSALAKRSGVILYAWDPVGRTLYAGSWLGDWYRKSLSE